MTPHLLEHGHRDVLPPLIGKKITNQLQLRCHLGDVGARLQFCGQAAQLLLKASEAGFAAQQGELQGVKQQIEAAGIRIGVTLLLGVGRGKWCQGCAEDLMIVGAERRPRLVLAEPLHHLQMGTHNEVVGGAGRHMATQEIGERLAMQPESVGGIAWLGRQ